MKILVKSKSKSKPFSKAGWNGTIDSVLNDFTFTINVWDDVAKATKTICPAKLYRDLIQKNIEALKYPSKNEIEDVQLAEKLAIKELETIIPALVLAHVSKGEKFALPRLENFQGSVELVEVPAGEKDFVSRDIKTGKPVGTGTSVWGDHYKLKATSKIPKNLKSTKNVKPIK